MVCVCVCVCAVFCRGQERTTSTTSIFWLKEAEEMNQIKQQMRHQMNPNDQKARVFTEKPVANFGPTATP